jgi:predicted lipoprotein with Yx(FWY)xxD motif
VVGSVGLLGVATPLAVGAAAGASGAPTTAVVVKVKAATRAGFGKILVTGAGAALYQDSDDTAHHPPTCTGGCATVWPPLTLPAHGVLKGVAGLGTVTAGGTKYVTYKGLPLYTFTGDSGTSVNGNGDGPFAVVAAP